MIYSKDSNLLTELKENRLNAILHSANCFYTMGGGIARQIAMQFPEAYEADKRDSVYGDRNKLGKFTYAQVLSDPPRFVYNMYSQFTFGMGKQTLYDAMVEGLERIRIHAISKGLTKLGLPFNMGCTLGGGNWKIVRPIIDSIFAEDSEIDLWICKYEP